MNLKFTDASIRLKILSIVAINIVFFFIITLTVLSSINTQNNNRDEILLNVKALNNFKDADMMHDAIRADVFKLLFIVKTNQSLVQSVTKDFREHSITFTESINAIESISALPFEIKNQLSNVKPALLNFLAFSNEMMTLGEKNDSISQSLLAAKSKEFQAVFDQLALENEALSQMILKNSEDVRVKAEETSKQVRWLIISIILVSILISIFLSILISNKLQKNVLTARDNLNELAHGNLPIESHVNSKDEIGQMMQALNVLTVNLKNVKSFAEEVGKGTFDSDISVFNNEGHLGIALDGMRKSLSNVAQDDIKRNWATNGVAEVGDILRANNKDLTILYDNLISFIVRYLKANQGGLFLLNDEVKTDVHLELVACYAYEKKKFIEKRIELKSGLVGQCYAERQIIYMTDVPNKYTAITSGLGDATPSCLILSPLKVNEEINGVIEIASFTPFESHQIEFIKRLSENISSVISSVKINDRTTRLLTHTQQQSEELLAQEEEMRQNLEELQATQEQFFRKEQEYINEIERLKKEGK
jgi:putative methionine-R-sulfoxide reductase with GAF domain